MYKNMLNKKGLTLIEVMVVSAIITVLALTALPNFLETRQRALVNICIGNLKQIERAKQVWAAGSGGGDPSWDDLVPAYLKSTPVCPAGGTYDIGHSGAAPACSVSGHRI